MTDLFSPAVVATAIAEVSPPATGALPPIPAKRYFTIGEVSDLCGVKAHVLRYWEQEFTQLKPLKRRGNRRYYQHHEVLLVRRIRELLYDQGYTIHGARIQLSHPLTSSNVNGNAVAAPLSAAQPVAEVPADLKATLKEIIRLLQH